MKKIIFILLLFSPALQYAQTTPDSLLGCYTGIYKHYDVNTDTTWTTIIQDTMIVYKLGYCPKKCVKLSVSILFTF